MNILYLNTTYQCGGAEKVTSQLFHGMQARGHQVYQIVSYDTKNSVMPPNVHVLYSSLPMRIFNRMITGNHSNTSFHIWYSRHFILRFIKKHHIDLVHLHNPHDNFLGTGDIADIAAICPVVWTLHDFWAMTGHCTYPYGCDDRWIDGCHKCPCLNNYPAIRNDVARQLFLKKSNSFQNSDITFTVPSDWMMQQFQKSHLANKPCCCIYNSLNTSVWKALDKKILRKKYNIGEGKKIIAFIAADPGKKLKGLTYLLDSLSQISNTEKYLLITAGKECPEINLLKNRFEVHSFGYLTSQGDLNDFYSLADVLINPSIYETFGLTTIEAMSCGTPVIAFPICTMPEIIDESCGWIASDVSAEALARTIQDAFSSPHVLTQKSWNSRQKAEKLFSEENMLNHFEQLYSKCLKKELLP